MSTIERVVMICPNLEHSGPTYNALTLSRALKKIGIATLTVGLAGGEREHAFFASGLLHLVEPHLGGLLRGRKGRRQLQEFKPEIIHAMDLSLTPVAKQVAQSLGAPLLVTVNSPISELEAYLCREKSVAYAAVSDAVYTQMVQLRRKGRGNVTLLHNGVDLSRFKLPEEEPATLPDKELPGEKSPAASLRSGHGAPVVGCFGTLRRNKGQHTLLRAAALVLEKYQDVEFLILGRGPELVSLKALAAELKITTRVTFTSGATFATAATDRVGSKLEAVFLRDFDIFVEPSTQEGLGLSVLQAMAWARPVIASGVGGLYSLVEDGETGLLVPKEDPAALARAIEELLTNPVEAREMGLRGRARIEAEFNIDAVAKQHQKVYQLLASGQDVGEVE
ncbi:MAG: glycosyltransferase family 4 protein [Planctomycetes bacterium]|nr:glycosyltransferase family 4 protein [Planctomycetota bacterium]